MPSPPAVQISREDFEELWQVFLERTMCVLDDWASKQQIALKDALHKVTTSKGCYCPTDSSSWWYAESPSPIKGAHRTECEKPVVPSRSVEPLWIQPFFTARSRVSSWGESIIEKVEKTIRECVARSNPPKGWLARAMGSWTAGFVTVAVIAANILVLGFSADNDVQAALSGRDKNERLFAAFSLAFTSFYLLEFLGRVYVQRIRLLFGDDWAWNLFDFVLLVLAIQDLSVSFLGSGTRTNFAWLRNIRILRLLRTLKLLGVIKRLRTLRVMLLAVVASVRGMFWGIILIVVITFAFGIWTTQACSFYLLLHSDEVDEYHREALLHYFGSVWKSATSLYLAALVGEGCLDMADTLLLVGEEFRLAFFAFLAFFSMVVINSITSLVVESIVKYGDSDNGAVVKLERDDSAKQMKMVRLLRQATGASSSGRVSFEELLASFEHKDFKACLSFVEIDIQDVKGFIEELHARGEVDIDVNEFVGSLMRLQGPVRAVDLLALQGCHIRAMERLFNLAQLSHLGHSKSCQLVSEPLASTDCSDSRSTQNVVL